MGEVKDTIKGSPPPAKKPKGAGPTLPDGQNLVQLITAFADRVAELTQMKQDDILNEGPAEKPENERKAATLSAAFRMATAIKTILEDY